MNNDVTALVLSPGELLGFTRKDDSYWMRIMANAEVVFAIMPDGRHVGFDTKMIAATSDKIEALLPPEAA